jgi:hypothetical protein
MAYDDFRLGRLLVGDRSLPLDEVISGWDDCWLLIDRCR